MAYHGEEDGWEVVSSLPTSNSDTSSSSSSKIGGEDGSKDVPKRTDGQVFAPFCKSSLPS